MQKETDGLPEQLNFVFFVFLALFSVMCRKKLAADLGGGGGGLKGSQTKIKTDTKVNHVEMIELYVFGLLYAMKKQYILNLTNVLAIFRGEEI